ncbi:MAG: alpha/beta fold hydrolase [Natrialbaceae archaeon]|nr:alpha/beta fold hydrolase [Natrialbaceae archaeon]
MSFDSPGRSSSNDGRNRGRPDRRYTDCLPAGRHRRTAGGVASWRRHRRCASILASRPRGSRGHPPGLRAELARLRASDDGIDHSIETYIDIVERFIERLGLESITLAGISMGGGAALGYALAHPERVDRLALVDSYGLGPRIPGGRIWKAAALVPGSNAMSFAAMGVSRAATRAGLGMVVADERRLEESFITDVRQRAQQPSVGRAFEDFQRNEIAMSGRARTNYAEELPDLEMPTLLVHGQEDPLFPAQWSAAAAQLIPDAELHLLERCGHWPTRERPARFGRIFRGFLEGS